jgi:hypothetical protein
MKSRESVGRPGRSFDRSPTEGITVVANEQSGRQSIGFRVLNIRCDACDVQNSVDAALTERTGTSVSAFPRSVGIRESPTFESLP